MDCMAASIEHRTLQNHLQWVPAGARLSAPARWPKSGRPRSAVCHCVFCLIPRMDSLLPREECLLGVPALELTCTATQPSSSWKLKMPQSSHILTWAERAKIWTSDSFLSRQTRRALAISMSWCHQWPAWSSRAPHCLSRDVSYGTRPSGRLLGEKFQRSDACKL